MIAYLPEIYPDELAYSWFCRYYVHTGCLTHKTALDDILYKRHNNPSKEFLGHLSPEILSAIQRMYPIETIIMEHTMFPQYARFIPLEQRNRALYHIGHDFCDVHHLFAVLPREEADLYLKYCPMCAEEDRRKYGEAYWHRGHQLRNIWICARHTCRLEKSTVTAKSEQTFTLCPAESYAIDKEPHRESDPLRIAYTKYITDVFHAPLDLDTDTPISAVLYHAMQQTKYLKSTGRTRYTKQLAEDMKAYYTGLDLSSVASMYQIQRVLLGDRFDFSVVCQIAFYLGVDSETLTNPALTAAQIQQEQSTHYMKDRTPIDWAVYDTETAPILEQIARSIYDGTASETGRPERVSEKAIYREMKFPGHRLENLPKCRAIFDKYSESYEENWARRIVWAYNKCRSERVAFYWSDIRRLTGVKKKNLEAVIPYIYEHTAKKTAEAIVELITE